MLRKTVKVGILTAVFSLPLYLVRFKAGWVPFNLSEAVIYLVFFLWLAEKVLKKEKPAFLTEEKKCLYPAFLIFAGATLSVFVSSDIEVSAGIWKGWFLAPLILFFVLLDCLNDKEFFKWLILAAVLSGTAVSLASLSGWLGSNFTYDGRLKGFYPSANELAMYLSPLLVLSLALFLFAKKNVDKLAVVGAICLMTTAVLMTYSYGAFSGLLAASVFLVFFLVREKKNSKWIILFLLLAVSLFAFQAQTDKFQGMLDLSYPSLKSRLAIWQSAWQIAQDHPLIGIGPGMFQKHYLAYQPMFAPYPEWAAPQPHNIFLAFWLQTGLIGLIGFIWLLIIFFRNIKKSCSRKDRTLVTILSAAMIAILVHGLTDTTYWKNDLAVIFWLVIAINCKAGRLFG